ncbi:MAG: hypothetical protein GC200_12365 [Tepidisphaera sp.]|nr:hypothetical protein [Tepidisphaera sp.]
MRHARAKLLSLAVACGVATLAFAGLMVQRINAYYKDHPPQTFVFQTVDMRSFTFAGKPVTLVDEDVGTDHETLVVTYGDSVERLRVTIPGNHKLPNLAPHSDWLRVLRFAKFEGPDIQELQAKMDRGEVSDRLAIVTRTPPPGADIRTWGAAWKKDWVFDFYELKPEGGFEHERLKYPTTSGVQKPKEGELHENTWEFQAAIQLMPTTPGIAPAHNFYGDALSAVSWLLPAAASTGVVGTFALAFAFAPPKRLV